MRRSPQYAIAWGSGNEASIPSHTSTQNEFCGAAEGGGGVMLTPWLARGFLRQQRPSSASTTP